jgi:hypothetical protein
MPVAGIVGDELDVTRLRHTDEDCVLRRDGGRSNPASFGACHVELVTVQVHRMVVHPQIHDTNAYPLSMLHDQRGRRRAGLPIHRQPVEFHGQRVGNGVVGEQRPFLQDDAEVAIDARRVRATWVDDEEADEAHLLHRHVRVVEERAVLLQRELVHETAARRDRILRDAGHAIHVVGDLEAVPMHRKGSGSRFSTLSRTRSPSVTWMVGPGMLPLKPQPSSARPGISSVRTCSTRMSNTLAPCSSRHGMFGVSGLTTGTMSGPN